MTGTAGPHLFMTTKLTDTTMNFDVNHLVRSVAIAGVGLPLAFSASNLLDSTASVAALATQQNAVQEVYAEYGEKLVRACIGYATSKVDTKLERESKNQIDEVMGGEVDYRAVCNAFVF